MVAIRMSHAADEEHLCLLEDVDYMKLNLEDCKKLVKSPKLKKDFGRAPKQSNGLGQKYIPYD